MEDRLGLVRAICAGELGMLGLCLLFVLLARARGDDIVGTEVEGTEDIKRDLAVETETLEPDGVYDITVLVEGTDLNIGL